MKKYFKSYFITWLLTLILFNVIIFMTPNEMQGYTKFGGAFWVGYIFIVISFIVQLVCSYIALNVDTMNKLFFNIPLIKISYSSLILTVIVGSLCMIIPNLPNWIGILICSLITIFEFISINKATFAATYAQNIEQNVERKTSNIKEMIGNIISLRNEVKDADLCREVDKVYELLKYSDPVSNDSLKNIESDMKTIINNIRNSLNNKEDVLLKIAELKKLIEIRNDECKKYK